MHKFKFLAITLIIVLFKTNAFSYSTDPKIFIQELVSDVMKTLENKDISKEDKIKKLNEIALEHVDIKGLAMYTLGDLRKSVDEKEKAEFNSVFEIYFLNNLSSRLMDYSKKKFDILEIDKKNQSYTIVKSLIESTDSSPEIKLDWRVYTKNPDKPLIRDLIIEGLSLARTQKEEFSSILSSNENKLSKLIEVLNNYNSN